MLPALVTVAVKVWAVLGVSVTVAGNTLTATAGTTVIVAVPFAVGSAALVATTW